MSDDAWRELARALGLDFTFVVDARVNRASHSFQTLQREMLQGRVRTSSYVTTPWLYGKRRQTSLLVHEGALKLVGEKPRHRAATHTTVVAEIDPPIFAGLRMMSRDLGALLGVATGDVPIGHPALDGRFLTYAHDVRRVRELFVGQPQPDGLAGAIASATYACSLVIKDSTVEAIAEEAPPTADRLESLVQTATSVAMALSERARLLRHTPLEIEARGSWQRLAARLGLSIDPLRWHIFGSLGGVDVSVMLEGSPPGVSTTFRARFRQSLPCELFLRRGSGGPPPGYPELNPLFVLWTSHPEQARATLGDVAVRLALARAAQSANVVMDDREILLGRGGFASTKEIAARLESVVALVDRLTPPLPVTGPFR